MCDVYMSLNSNSKEYSGIESNRKAEYGSVSCSLKRYWGGKEIHIDT